MKKTSSLICLAVFLLAGAGGGAYFYAERSRGNYCPDCNVILISIDTLRPDHLNSYGYGLNTAPNIQAFGAESVVFTKAVSHAPSTAPSHASMLTSLIPSMHGAFISKKTAISLAAPTLAEILSARGFRTASFNGGGQLDASLGFSRGFDTYQSFGSAPKRDRFKDRIQESIDWIRGQRSRQFFLFLHSYEVHHPYAPEPEDLAAFSENYSGPLRTPVTPRVLWQIYSKKISIDENDKRFIIANYDAEIRGMDRAFLRLKEFLTNAGLYDKTLIVFTSDHGEEFGEHGKVGWHSHTLYDELLRVPLIIKFPFGMFAGRSIDAQVRGIDLAPTILQILGSPRPEPYQGASVLALLESESAPDSARDAVSQRDCCRFKRIPTAIRTDKWKLYNQQLFDLENDRIEQHNVADANPEVYAELHEQLTQALRQSLGPKTKAGRLNQKNLEQLKSLGYLR